MADRWRVREVLVEVAVAGDGDPCAVHDPLHPPPAQHRYLLGQRDHHLSVLRRGQECPGQRMGRLHLQRGGVQEAAVLGTLPTGAQVDQVGRHRLSRGQRPGLVEREGPHPAQHLQVPPALDQHPVRGSVGHGADQTDRCADHQGARTRDDQHLQRPHQPAAIAPERQAKQKRGQGGHQHCCHRHRRGVDAGEAVDEPLHRRSTGLCLLHQCHHPAQGVVRCRARHLDLQCTVGVDRPGEDHVPWLLVHRHALTGDRGLIDGAPAGQHHPVHAHPVAGPDPHPVSDRQVLHRHLLDPSIWEELQRHGRCQVEQAVQRATRLFGGVPLQRLAQREQHHHDGRLGPLADERRAHDGDHHQCVDAQAARPPQLVDGVACYRDSAHEHRRAEQSNLGPLRSSAGRRAQAEECEQASDGGQDRLAPGEDEAGEAPNGVGLSVAAGDQGVARRTHGLGDRLRVQVRVGERHSQRTGGGIDHGMGHAVHPADRGLHPVGAVDAGQSRDDEGPFRHVN